ncbi:hypothetical protein ABZS80_08175, partial [Micromonospora sp. NPDC005305]
VVAGGGPTPGVVAGGGPTPGVVAGGGAAAGIGAPASRGAAAVDARWAGAAVGGPAGVSGGASAGSSARAALPALRSGGNRAGRAGRAVRARLGVFPGLRDALPGGPPRESAGRVGPVGGRPPTVGPPRPRRTGRERPVGASARAGLPLGGGVLAA